MKIDLSGRTAIITASTKGIGLAVAKELGSAGADVIINGRSQEAVDRAIAAIAKAGGSARGVVADIGGLAGCETLIAAQPSADILINNVAVIGWGAFDATADAVWHQVWETNVMSGVRLARHYLGGMVERKWGRLLFVSSESARNVQPDLIAYGASKLALHAVSRGLAKQVAGTGVTSNVVLPGPTLSDGARSMLAPMVNAAVSIEEAGAAFVRQHRSSSLIQRMATVEEVAAMMVYLCSPQASATSGSVLRVDGGVVDDVS